MYEKKNKLSQPVPILDGISVWLLDAIVIVMKNAPFFFKTLILDGCFDRCFKKYKLNMPFCDDIGRYFTF